MSSSDTTHASATRLSRRSLADRLAAAGFSTPVVASILAREGSARIATPEASPALAASTDDDLREVFGLDDRLIAYDSLNYGTPLDAVDGLVVPTDLFFVRNNGPVPLLDPATWRLRIGGLVDIPLALSLDHLKSMETRTVTAVLECSGNSRSSYEPITNGTPWDTTAVGNAAWTGTPLGPILDLAGIQEGAVEIVTQGGDSPDMQRGLPLGKALAPETMLVWGMNGEDLPVVHGAPVRLLVPGWGGIASTKWLVGIEVIDHAFDGPLNTDSYTISDASGHRIRPVREMPAKSVITHPVPGAVLAAGPQTLRGYAWSGYGEIASVEVSTDGGAEWVAAEIVEEAGRLSWVRFEANWNPEPGQTSPYARATDELMMTQPVTAPWNARGYQYNAIFEVPVTVE